MAVFQIALKWIIFDVVRGVIPPKGELNVEQSL